VCPSHSVRAAGAARNASSVRAARERGPECFSSSVLIIILEKHSGPRGRSRGPAARTLWDCGTATNAIQKNIKYLANAGEGEPARVDGLVKSGVPRNWSATVNPDSRGELVMVWWGAELVVTRCAGDARATRPAFDAEKTI